MMMRMVTEFVQGSDPIYQTDDTPNEQKLFPACPGIIFEDKGRGYKASVMCAQFEGRYYHGMTVNSDVAHHVSYPRTFRTPFTSRAWAVEAALEEVAEIASFVSEHPVWIEMMRLVKEKKAK
jgi:hypothetical protein